MRNLGLFVLAILFSMLVGLLGTKVILSVTTLYQLSFISSLGFLKIYGLTSVIQLLLYKRKLDEVKGNSSDKKIKKAFDLTVNKLMLYLVFWGMSYTMYYLISNFIN